MSAVLTPGVTVFRVVDDFRPCDDDDGWEVQSRTVARAGPKRFRIDRAFPGTTLEWFDNDRLGVLVHLTRAGAIEQFLRNKRAELGRARKDVANAERAIAWSLIEMATAVAVPTTIDDCHTPGVQRTGENGGGDRPPGTKGRRP